MYLIEHSVRVGKTSSYFSVEKKINRKRFDMYLEIGGGSVSEGYLNYRQAITDDSNKLIDILYTLSDTKGELNNFYRELIKNGVYKTYYIAVKGCSHCAYSSKLSDRGHIQLKRILEVFDKRKEIK